MVSLNHSGGALSSTAGVLGSTVGSGGGGGGGGGSEDPEGTPYYTSETVRTSDYSGLQAALNDVSKPGTVIIDDQQPGDVQVPSDVKIEGSDTVGTHIRFPNGSNNHGLQIYGESNIWIDGVTLDGNRSNQTAAGHGIGGPGNNGTCSNIRISNCTIEEMRVNGISLIAQENDAINDVYISSNIVSGVGGHCVVVGASKANSHHSATFRDGVIRDSTFEDYDDGQGVGVFGAFIGASNTGLAERVVVTNNVVGSPGADGQCVSFEEDVRNSIHYANVLGPQASGSIMSSAKSGQRTAHVHNYIEDNDQGQNGANFVVFDYFIDAHNGSEGPPRLSVIQNNEITNCGNAFRFRCCDSDNAVYHNLVYNNSLDDIRCITSNCGGSSSPNWSVGCPRVDAENGPNTSGDGVGRPSTPGNSVVTRNEDDTADTVNASWDVGDQHPDNPVSVSCTVTPENFNAW